jgi:quinol monooxygenase YgiN
MFVAEFTLPAKPGHFDEVAALYAEFAAEFLSEHEALVTVLVTGDEGRGVVRGIGVFTDREAADAVNADPEFAAFNDAIEPLLAGPAERVELELLHLFSVD